MKIKYFILLSFLFIVNRLNSQPGFAEGYFIDNNGNRTECEISVNPFIESPIDFLYRSYINSKIYKATLDDVKEFGVYNNSRYIKLTVNIDQSSTIKKNLSTNKDPNFVPEMHFLRVVVEGIVKLYAYEDQTKSLYFYSINDSTIQPLIYKQYLGDDPDNPKNGLLKMTNLYYQEQLYKDLNCNNLPMSYFEEIKYDKYALKEYFQKENAYKTNNGSANWISPGPLYAKGYFIDNQDKKTECFISKNQGISNIIYFNYMLPGVANQTHTLMDSVKEFKFYGGAHFVRATVQIDRSSDNVITLSVKKNPEYSTETLYLKVLVEGYASLFYYEDINNYRFFYSIKNNPIQQLVKKQFLVYMIDDFHYISADPNDTTVNISKAKNMNKKVATNNYYHQQLYNDINFNNLPINKITTIGYNYTDLTHYFKKENACRAFLDIKQ